MRRSNTREEAEVQTVLICSPHILPVGAEANVICNQSTQTVASAPPFASDEALYDKLGRTDVSEIRDNCLRILPYRRIRKLHFELPDEEFTVDVLERPSGLIYSEFEEEDSAGNLFKTKETQTYLRVFPHYLRPRERASILCDLTTQTDLSCEPQTSVVDIIPQLRSYFLHTGREMTAGERFEEDSSSNASILDLIKEILQNVDKSNEQLFDEIDSLTADSSYSLIVAPPPKPKKNVSAGTTNNKDSTYKIATSNIDIIKASGCENKNTILFRKLLNLNVICNKACNYPESKCVFMSDSDKTFNQCIPCPDDDQIEELKLLHKICENEKTIPGIHVTSIWGESTRFVQQYETEISVRYGNDESFHAQMRNNDSSLIVTKNGDKIFIDTETTYNLTSAQPEEIEKIEEEILEGGDRCCSNLPLGSERKNCQHCLCNGVKINLCIKNFGLSPSDDTNKIMLDLNLHPGFEKLEVKEIVKEEQQVQDQLFSENCCQGKTDNDGDHICPIIMNRVEKDNAVHFIEEVLEFKDLECGCDMPHCTCFEIEKKKKEKKIKPKELCKKTIVKKSKSKDILNSKTMSISNLLGGSIMTLVSKNKEGFDVVININNPILQGDQKDIISVQEEKKSTYKSDTSRKGSCTLKYCNCSGNVSLPSSPVKSKRCCCKSRDCRCSPEESLNSRKGSLPSSPVKNKRCSCKSKECRCSPEEKSLNSVITPPVNSTRCSCSSKYCNCVGSASLPSSPIKSKRCSCNSKDCRCSPEGKSLNSDKFSSKISTTVDFTKTMSFPKPCTASAVDVTKTTAFPKPCTACTGQKLDVSFVQKSKSAPENRATCISTTSNVQTPESTTKNLSELCGVTPIEKSKSFSENKTCSATTSKVVFPKTTCKNVSNFCSHCKKPNSVSVSSSPIKKSNSSSKNEVEKISIDCTPRSPSTSIIQKPEPENKTCSASTAKLAFPKTTCKNVSNFCSPCKNTNNASVSSSQIKKSKSSPENKATCFSTTSKVQIPESTSKNLSEMCSITPVEKSKSFTENESNFCCPCTNTNSVAVSSSQIKKSKSSSKNKVEERSVHYTPCSSNTSVVLKSKTENKTCSATTSKIIFPKTACTNDSNCCIPSKKTKSAPVSSTHIKKSKCSSENEVEKKSSHCTPCSSSTSVVPEPKPKISKRTQCAKEINTTKIDKKIVKTTKIKLCYEELKKCKENNEEYKVVINTVKCKTPNSKPKNTTDTIKDKNLLPSKIPQPGFITGQRSSMDSNQNNHSALQKRIDQCRADCERTVRKLLKDKSPAKVQDDQTWQTSTPKIPHQKNRPESITDKTKNFRRVSVKDTTLDSKMLEDLIPEDNSALQTMPEEVQDVSGNTIPPHDKETEESDRHKLMNYDSWKTLSQDSEWKLLLAGTINDDSWKTIQPEYKNTEQSARNSLPDQTPNDDSWKTLQPENKNTEQSARNSLPDQTPNDDSWKTLQPENKKPEESEWKTLPAQTPNDDSWKTLQPENKQTEESEWKTLPAQTPNDDSWKTLQPENKKTEEPEWKTLPAQTPNDDSWKTIPPEHKKIAEPEETVWNTLPAQTINDDSWKTLQPEYKNREQSLSDQKHGKVTFKKTEFYEDSWGTIPFEIPPSNDSWKTINQNVEPGACPADYSPPPVYKTEQKPKSAKGNRPDDRLSASSVMNSNQKHVPPVVPSAHTTFHLPNNTVLNVRFTLDVKEAEQKFKSVHAIESAPSLPPGPFRTDRIFDMNRLEEKLSVPSVTYLKKLNKMYTDSSRTINIYQERNSDSSIHSKMSINPITTISVNANLIYDSEIHIAKSGTKSTPNLNENCCSRTTTCRSSKKSSKQENKDVVFMAYKTCEEELKPALNALTNIKQELRMLNMPEIDCIFKDPDVTLVERSVTKEKIPNTDTSELNFTPVMKVRLNPSEGMISQKKMKTKIKINYIAAEESTTKICPYCYPQSRPKFEVINTPSQPRIGDKITRCSYKNPDFSDSGRSTPKIYSTSKIKIIDSKTYRKHYKKRVSSSTSKSSQTERKYCCRKTSAVRFAERVSHNEIPKNISVKVCNSKVGHSRSSSSSSHTHKPKFDSAYCSYPNTSATYPTYSKQSVPESLCSKHDKRVQRKKSSDNSLSVNASTSSMDTVSSHVSSEAFVCPARHKCKKKAKRRKLSRCSCTSSECPFFEAFVRTMQRITDSGRDRR